MRGLRWARQGLALSSLLCADVALSHPTASLRGVIQQPRHGPGSSLPPGPRAAGRTLATAHLSFVRLGRRDPRTVPSPATLGLGCPAGEVSAGLEDPRLSPRTPGSPPWEAGHREGALTLGVRPRTQEPEPGPAVPTGFRSDGAERPGDYGQGREPRALENSERL